MSIGSNIKRIRLINGLTQVELAAKANISRSYLGDLEKDRYNPSLVTLDRIAEVMNSDIREILDKNNLDDLTADYELKRSKTDLQQTKIKKGSGVMMNKMPNQEIVKMGLNAFFQVYGNIPADESFRKVLIKMKKDSICPTINEAANMIDLLRAKKVDVPQAFVDLIGEIVNCEFYTYDDALVYEVIKKDSSVTENDVNFIIEVLTQFDKSDRIELLGRIKKLARDMKKEIADETNKKVG